MQARTKLLWIRTKKQPVAAKLSAAGGGYEGGPKPGIVEGNVGHARNSMCVQIQLVLSLLSTQL